MIRLAVLGAVWATACSFSIAPSGGDDDPVGGQRTITDDTAADFAAHAELHDGVIAARGAIEPAAFVVGGLHARAYAGNLMDDASTWDSVVADTASRPLLGEGYRHVPTDWSPDAIKRPRGLGITTTGNFTVLYDGEILLPAGEVMLQVAGDERVVVQVALDGSTFGERLFAKNQTRAITLDVPAPGWYPVRAAYSQAGGDARFVLSLIPAFSAAIPVDGARLRSRVTAAPGLLLQAFTSQVFAVPAGEAATAVIGGMYGATAPALDLGLSADDFSLRFAGQIRIDEAGTYTFGADVGTQANDGFRIWIDGQLIAHRWLPAPEQLVGTVDLAPGWHDLLVDFNEDEDTAQLAVQMSGPGVPEGPIDPARLRPVMASGLTASTVVAGSIPLADATIAGPGVTSVLTPLVGPAGAVIDFLDFGIGIGSQRMSDLTLDRLDCDGSTPLALQPTPVFHYYASDTSCAGAAVPQPTWGFRVIDRVIGNDPTILTQPTLYAPLMVATYHGGDRIPFAPAVTYVSAPRPTPGAIRYGPVALTTDLRGGAIVFEVRTAADEAALASAPWFAVVDGEVPGAPVGELLQYRLTITTDGWQLATVDKVVLTYAVPE